MNNDLYFEIDPESDSESAFGEEADFEFDEYESNDPELEGETGFRGGRPQSRFRGQQRRGSLQRRRRRQRGRRRGFPGLVNVGGFTAASGAPCGCGHHASEYVRWLQLALNDVLGERLPTTGVMSAATRNAIRAFQQRQGLPVDGVAGPETKKALVMARAAGGQSGGASQPSSGAAGPSANQPTDGDDGASEFETDTEFEFEYDGENGSDEQEAEFEWQLEQDTMAELETKPTGYPFRCTGDCPKASTADCRATYAKDRALAVKMALKAARLIASPNTKVGGTKVGDIYKRIFAHLPSRKVPWAGNATSGSITIKRLNAAAKALKKGFFPITCGGPQCTADPSPNAWTITSGKSARIELCANYWGNTNPAIRAGILIHETLHAFFNVIGDVSTTARRVNAHCYEALVLLLHGIQPDPFDLTSCDETTAPAVTPELEFVWEGEDGSKPPAGMQPANMSRPPLPHSFVVDGFDKGQTSLGARQAAQLRRVFGTLRRSLRKNRRVEVTIK